MRGYPQLDCECVFVVRAPLTWVLLRLLVVGPVASWSLTINLASREVVREICRGEWG
jgi:hypothetical protein